MGRGVSAAKIMQGCPACTREEKGMSLEGRIKFYCPCKCAARSMPEAGGALNIYLQIIG